MILHLSCVLQEKESESEREREKSNTCWTMHQKTLFSLLLLSCVCSVLNDGERPVLWQTVSNRYS